MSSELDESQVVLDVATVGYIRCDSELRFTSLNRAAANLLCAELSAVRGMKLQDVPAVAGPIEQACRHVLAGEASPLIEHYSETLGRWYAVTVLPDPVGGVVIELTDITDRKQAEDALRKSE